MNATIYKYHSPDVYDFDSWCPKNPESFSYLLQVFIGPEGLEGEEGGESFEFIVCTPMWLLEKYGEDAVVALRHYLLVFHHDFAQVKGKIKWLVEKARGENWNEIATWIGRYGKWEFENSCSSC